MRDIEPQAKKAATAAVDIDPRTMVEFMDRWVDVRREKQATVVGPRRRCEACDYGLGCPCTCRWPRVNARWNDVKTTTRKN
jgi:hypothetical protein